MIEFIKLTIEKIGDDILYKESCRKFPNLTQTSKYYKKDLSDSSDYSKNYENSSNIDTYNSSNRNNKELQNTNIIHNNHNILHNPISKQIPLKSYYKKDVVSIDEISDELFSDAVNYDDAVVNLNYYKNDES